MVNPELVVGVCVCERREKDAFMMISCISSRARILDDNFLLNLEVFIDVSFFLPIPFENFPKLNHHTFQKNSTRNPFISNHWWKIKVTSKIQPINWQSFD